MYNYTDPKMQEVSKFCQRGFWPICKNGNGRFAVFTPILDQDNYWKRSFWKDEIDEAKQNIGDTYSNNGDKPTEIVGYYHPPIYEFEIGDKVKVREDLKSLQLENYGDYQSFLKTAGNTGIVSHYYGFNNITVNFTNESYTYTTNQLEPVIEPEPVIIEMTLAQIEKKLGVKNLKIVK